MEKRTRSLRRIGAGGHASRGVQRRCGGANWNCGRLALSPSVSMCGWIDPPGRRRSYHRNAQKKCPIGPTPLSTRSRRHRAGVETVDRIGTHPATSGWSIGCFSAGGIETCWRSAHSGSSCAISNQLLDSEQHQQSRCRSVLCDLYAHRISARFSFAISHGDALALKKKCHRPNGIPVEGRFAATGQPPRFAVDEHFKMRLW